MADNPPTLADIGEFRDGLFRFHAPFMMPDGHTVEAIRLPEAIPIGLTRESVIEGFLESLPRGHDTGMTIDGKPVYESDLRVSPVPQSAEVRAHTAQSGNG